MTTIEKQTMDQPSKSAEALAEFEIACNNWLPKLNERDKAKALAYAQKAAMADDSKQQSETVIMPGAQEGKPIPRGLQPGKAHENAGLRDPANRNKGGRPRGSPNRYTGALKELFLQAVDEVGDRTTIGPNGEMDGNGGALAYLKVTAITERKTFFTAMARVLPITIKTAPPLKKVLTREEALAELKARGLDPELINHLRRLPFPVEEKSRLDEMYPPIVELDEDEYVGDKQVEPDGEKK